MPVEEVKIEEEVLEGRKKNRKKRNMLLLYLKNAISNIKEWLK
jgi:hypothetical protein